MARDSRPAKPARKSGRFRLDFDFVGVEGDVIKLRLNPERYEVQEGGDIFDRFDNLLISRADFERALQEQPPIPVFHQATKISDWSKYLMDRMPAIYAMLCGELPQCPLVVATETLRNKIGQSALFSIVRFKITNALAVSAGIDDSQFVNISRAFAYEAAQIAFEHLGEPLDLTLEGMTFFFPAPSYISKADLAANFLRVMDSLVFTFNALLAQLGILPLTYRAALESGEALVESLGHADVDIRIEVLGQVRTVADFLCDSSVDGETRVGPRAAAALHISWRKLLEELTGPSPAPIFGEFGDRRVYRLRFMDDENTVSISNKI